MSTYRLNSLLAPNSVALVGASTRSGSVGRAIIKNIRTSRFENPFGVVNSHYREIEGISTVKRLAELPFVPELVIVTTPARNGSRDRRRSRKDRFGWSHHYQRGPRPRTRLIGGSRRARGARVSYEADRS